MLKQYRRGIKMDFYFWHMMKLGDEFAKDKSQEPSLKFKAAKLRYYFGRY